MTPDLLRLLFNRYSPFVAKDKGKRSSRTLSTVIT